METIDVPVLVVGGGGCGLSASVLLSDHGVDHLLVERHPDTSTIPKAHYLNQRTMEVYRQHGLAADVLAAGAPLDKFGMVRWQTTLGGDGELDGRVIHEMDAFGGGRLRASFEAAGPVMPTKLPQHLLEPILRSHAEQRNPGGIRFGQELVSWEDTGDRVLAQIRDRVDGRLTTVSARYVIAADGGRTMGPRLGVTMQGLPGAIEVTTVYFSADLSPWWREGTLITHFLSPYDADLSSNLIEMGPTWGRGCEQWGLHFAAGPARFDEQTVVPRIREVLGLPDLDLQLHRVTHWTQQTLIADSYRKGRVLLAGDAVHRQPPAVGLGLNTGIQDAHNLAWKLAAVLGEHAGEGLLDSYETERHQVGKENVEWALSAAFHHQGILNALGAGPHTPPRLRAVRLGEYFADTPLGQAARARMGEVFDTHRGGCQAHDMEIGFSYDAGALVPDGSPQPPRVPMRDVHRPSSRPGRVLPHAWVERDGRRISTHDLVGVGTGLLLLVGEQGAAWTEAAARVAADQEVRIDAVAVGAGGDCVDVDGTWRAVREISEAGALLVRADNHVAWRSLGADPAPATALGEAVAQILAHPVTERMPAVL